MNNMKMKTKLMVGFFIPILLTIINALVGILSINKIVSLPPEREETYGQGANIFAVVTVILSIIITLIIAVMLIRIIEKSVKQLSDVAKEIALGHVNNIQMVKFHNDEFGDLVDEYGKVIDNIKYQASIAEEVSNGNLTVTVKPSSAEDMLGNSLKKLVEDNLRVLSNISDVGSQVTISSSQVASASQALAQGSTEQASAIQEITASIDEIAGKTKQNAEQANDAASLVAKAIEDVKRGNQQMQDMVTAMQDINKASESISKIIKVIGDISFQTNILALNAAVEAARAGEAGKGFAVVADEVKKLAEQSSEAVMGTEALINKTIDAVEHGSNLAEETSSILQQVATLAQKSTSIMKEVTISSKDQSVKASEVLENINKIQESIETNSAASQETAASTEEESAQTERLNKLLSQFQLRE